MSGTPRKPSTPSQPTRRTPSTEPQASPGGARNSPNPSANGLGRTPSARQSPVPVSARAAARRPGAGRSNLSMSNVPRTADMAQEDDARAESAAVIEELKEQIQKSEAEAEQYRKQLGVLAMKLDEVVTEQTKSEDHAHEKDSIINLLRDEIRELSRQLREMDQVHETERAAMLKEKEAHTSREEELQTTIQRLKETIAQKDLRMNVDTDRSMSRSPSFRNRSADSENGQFAPSSQLQRSPSRNNSKLILQKDKLIESLRLELAEAQIKLVEMENRGGGREQHLEKELLEARMANARLMEDNESYQLLLSEKTLNGDFSKADFMQTDNTSTTGTGMGSLADELESVGVGEEAESRRRFEGEIKSLKDQNKALSLYIERIIGRLLQTEGFEHILDKNENEGSPPKVPSKDKDLPAPPPQEKTEGVGQTFLQRARSVVARKQDSVPQRPARQRPVSQYTQSPLFERTAESQPSAHEDPKTAPSVPIGRSRTKHRRSRSDQVEPGAVASVVGQMYRGPPARSSTAGPMSPGFSPTLTGQGPLFSPTQLASNRASMSGGSGSVRSHDRVVSSGGSITSDRSGEVGSTAGISSPQRSNTGMNNYTGAVMTQNKLRPLRLVQENKELEQGPDKAAEEAETSRKKANRTSWISWLNPNQTQNQNQNPAA